MGLGGLSRGNFTAAVMFQASLGGRLFPMNDSNEDNNSQHFPGAWRCAKGLLTRGSLPTACEANTDSIPHGAGAQRWQITCLLGPQQVRGRVGIPAMVS